MRRTLQERFSEKVSPEPMSGCWLWTGAADPNGYGHIRAGGKKMPQVGAHRVAWELANGTIPDGLFVCHRCDNPACVNPAHLFLGTSGDNMRDKVRKGRCGDTRAHRVARGSGHHKAKLNEETVVDVKRLLSEGRLTQKEIGRRFGISQTAVHYINIGRNWR